MKPLLLLPLTLLFGILSCERYDASTKKAAVTSIPDSISIKFGYMRSPFPSCSLRVVASRNRLVCQVFPFDTTSYTHVRVLPDTMVADSLASLRFRESIVHILGLPVCDDHGQGPYGTLVYAYVAVDASTDTLWKWCPKKDADPKEWGMGMLGAGLAHDLTRSIKNKRYFWGLMLEMDNRVFDSLKEPFGWKE